MTNQEKANKIREYIEGNDIESIFDEILFDRSYTNEITKIKNAWNQNKHSYIIKEITRETYEVNLTHIINRLLEIADKLEKTNKKCQKLILNSKYLIITISIILLAIIGYKGKEYLEKTTKEAKSEITHDIKGYVYLDEMLISNATVKIIETQKRTVTEDGYFEFSLKEDFFEMNYNLKITYLEEYDTIVPLTLNNIIKVYFRSKEDEIKKKVKTLPVPNPNPPKPQTSCITKGYVKNAKGRGEEGVTVIIDGEFRGTTSVDGSFRIPVPIEYENQIYPIVVMKEENKIHITGTYVMEIQ